MKIVAESTTPQRALHTRRRGKLPRVQVNVLRSFEFLLWVLSTYNKRLAHGHPNKRQSNFELFLRLPVLRILSQ